MEPGEGILGRVAEGDRGGACLVGAILPGRTEAEVAEHLAELASLVDTAGFHEAGRAILPLRRIHPATFVGRGQAAEIGEVARALDAAVIVVDEELSPAQVRNLEKTCGLPVVDRAGVIIDIFAIHARSREARLQVELARLEYLLPRLAGRWTHLSRQVGGGPGGTKGEGEKQIELDRRMIRRRIDRLRRELARLDRGRAVRRRARRGLPQAALVGYTNVGKSSLFNALVRGDVRVEDRLFATLDPTVRRLEAPPRGTVLLKDTVGFIRKLPHHLVASFRSTFAEADEADLLVLVLDLSHPAADRQREVTERVLEASGLGARPRVVAWNKADLVPREVVEGIRTREPDALVVSARTGEGLDELREALLDRLLGRALAGEVSLPAERGDLLAWLHRVAEIRDVFAAGEDLLRVSLRAPRDVFGELERRLRAGA